jgi:aspartate/methionine/tyrosine aminotransferase
VLEAVAAAAGRSGRYEPDPRGPLEARQALAAYLGGEADDYWLTASTSLAYQHVFAIVGDPGGLVAVPAPGYPLIDPLAALSGLRTAAYPWHYVHPHGWWLDPQPLAALANREELAAIVAVNPGNPTGAYVDGDDRETVLAACQQADVALICDEVFAAYPLQGQPSSLSGEGSVVTFTLGGLSKLVCAPQLKLAWLRLSGPPGALGPVRSALDHIADAYLSPASPVALALPEILAASDDVHRLAGERLAANLVTARQVLGHAPYRVRRCDGGWSVIVDVPRYLEADDLVCALMRDSGLSVHPGWFYDLPDSGALALSLLPEPNDFAERCRRLREGVDALAP